LAFIRLARPPLKVPLKPCGMNKCGKLYCSKKRAVVQLEASDIIRIVIIKNQIEYE